MKKNNYGVVLSMIALFLACNISAEPRRRTINRYDIDNIVKEYQIADRYKPLLYSAALSTSNMILGYETDIVYWSHQYPSNVLRAARDIAARAQGISSQAYCILERMLSYK